MDIKEFRIVESALNGFYIQRLFKIETYKWFLFWIVKTEIKEEWKNIDRHGQKPCYSHIINHWLRDPMPPFESKNQAIEYLEKLCTPNKFYYPDGFNLGLSNNIPELLKSLKGNLNCNHVWGSNKESHKSNLNPSYPVCIKCGYTPDGRISHRLTKDDIHPMHY